MQRWEPLPRIMRLIPEEWESSVGTALPSDSDVKSVQSEFTYSEFTDPITGEREVRIDIDLAHWVRVMVNARALTRPTRTYL